MVDLAERLGADHLVTGHYARIVDDGAGPLLAAAADAAKDQSYMLAALPPALLARVRFPLTELTKPEVREIAARHGLAGRPQAREPGPLLPRRPGQGATSCAATAACASARATSSTAPGRAIGRHRGHHNFTVGQRRGIGVSAPEPLYVLATDAAANTVTVGTREELAASAGADPRRRPAPRRRHASTRSGCATARAAVPAAVAAAGTGRHAELEVELGEAFAGAAPGRRRCCLPARRSSATARSPALAGLRAFLLVRGAASATAFTQRENAVPFSPLTCFLLLPLQAWPGLSFVVVRGLGHRGHAAARTRCPSRP